ncbi:mannosidase, endo-alpha, putative [Pediculus humanus corporis]|uniref:Mannosidase, endo-alpha, putative n=1 Tax=Pediculus humanus subsp. corporis TaxID=121224 RepID=E0W317_PEDHC|nr:mannosidase, endo-alpha, putative [Pediculus humanus corporis]EEB20023.1 mannosidase, endo-alpha, putative [Pediculus humanus corporis]
MLKNKIKELNRIRMKYNENRHYENFETNQTIFPINYNVHIFYYAWYENLRIDGKWEHWNHEYIKNWRKNDERIYPRGRHVPPDDIGSNYYPKLGCYSSKDVYVINEHMKQISNAGIGVLVVSWYPPGMSDGSYRSPDEIFSSLLDSAEKYKLKLAPHIEPYENRNPYNLLENIKYFKNKYGNHPSLYKIKRGEKNLIVYYIYDSYRIPAISWRELLGPNGNISIRETSYDGIFLGLLVDSNHKYEIKKAKFDGFYTYFASNGFSYGSTWKNWKTLSHLASSQNLIFVPSIGPGYVDTRVRPWNAMNTRDRRHGKYYEVGWRAAISAGVDYVSITSFNEWHEGTQIEPAIRKNTINYTYLDYEPEGSDFYLKVTKYWIHSFTNKRRPIPIL